MRELDVLLTAYFEKVYSASGEAQKAAFRQVLNLPDPELMRYLLSGENPTDPEQANVIDCIRGSAMS